MSVQLFKYVGCIKLSALILAIAAAGAAAVPEASAQGFSIYPTQGQSQDQLNRDRFECHNWGVGQSRFDSTPAQYSAPPQEGQVARGATGGAAVGAIGGNADAGAAIGASTGALIGGIRRRQQQQEYQNQASASATRQNAYSQSCDACLQSRGCTLN